MPRRFVGVEMEMLECCLCTMSADLSPSIRFVGLGACAWTVKCTFVLSNT